jgi:general secretion pathway protein C
MNIATRAQTYLNDWIAENGTPKWLDAFISNQLPTVVTLLLVLLVSWRAADITWSLIPAPEVPYHVPPEASNTSSTTKPGPADSNQLADLAKLHLFGVAGVTKPKKVDKKAPETHLNLTLHGVFVAEKPEMGAAIIGTGSTQKYYRVGSGVISGVTLQAVFTDRVVLLRKGQSEVLRFPKVKSSNLVNDRRTAKRSRRSSRTKDNFGPRTSAASASGANLSQYRDMLREEPLKVFEYVRFVPVKSRDGMKGYRILPQKNRELYNQLGVRPSDLVTAVNGIPLTNDKEAMKLFDQLKDAQNLQVDIIRNGQSRSLSFDLN